MPAKKQKLPQTLLLFNRFLHKENFPESVSTIVLFTVVFFLHLFFSISSFCFTVVFYSLATNPELKIIHFRHRETKKQVIWCELQNEIMVWKKRRGFEKLPTHPSESSDGQVINKMLWLAECEWKNDDTESSERRLSHISCSKVNAASVEGL